MIPPTPAGMSTRFYPILFAVIGARGMYLGIRIVHYLLFPTGSFSIPVGWTIHIVLMNSIFFVGYGVVAIGLAWMTYPIHWPHAWTAGWLVPVLCLYSHTNIGTMSDVANISFRIRLYVEALLPGLVAFPAFLSGAWFVEKWHHRKSTGP
jgi:hypothetical protein